MTTYRVQLGDFIELNMAEENERPIAPWTMMRLYPIISALQSGDMIEVTPELPQREHYGAWSVPTDETEAPA